MDPDSAHSYHRQAAALAGIAGIGISISHGLDGAAVGAGPAGLGIDALGPYYASASPVAAPVAVPVVGSTRSSSSGSSNSSTSRSRSRSRSSRSIGQHRVGSDGNELGLCAAAATPPKMRTRPAPPPKPIHVALADVIGAGPGAAGAVPIAADSSPQLSPLAISPLSPRWDHGPPRSSSSLARPSTPPTPTRPSHHHLYHHHHHYYYHSPYLDRQQPHQPAHQHQPPPQHQHQYQHQQHQQHRLPPRSATPSSVRAPSSSLSFESRHDPQSGQSPVRPSHPLAPRADAAAFGPRQQRQRQQQRQQQIENFSRPRKASQINDSGYEFLSPAASPPPSSDWHADSLPLRPEPTSMHTFGVRSRGPSISSVNTSSTFASVPLPRYRDIIRPDDDGSPAPGPEPGRPPLAPYRVDITASPWLRDPTSRLTDGTTAGSPEIMRSSVRSQLTESSAPWTGGSATERESTLTKDSSVTSLDPSLGEEPSVEDVMCLYETGFNDTEPSDQGGDFLNGGPGPGSGNSSRPQTAWSAPDQRASTLFMFSTNDILAMPSLPVLSPPPPPLPAPPPPPYSSDPRIRLVPRGGPEEDADDEIEGRNSSGSPAAAAGTAKRDSGKSLRSGVFPAASAKLARVREGAAEIVSEHPNVRDRYGFRKENQYITQGQYDRWNLGYTDYLARRRKKWIAYLKESSLMTDKPNRFPARNNKTKRFVRKGIPPDWRGAAWFYYAGGPALMAKNTGVYQRLVQQEAKSVDVEAVERDLHRTFPDNVKFRPPLNTSGSRRRKRRPRAGGGGGAAAAEDREPQQEGMEDATEPVEDEKEAEEEDEEDEEEEEEAEEGYRERKEEPIISSLRRVLLAFSIHNPKIGYCQSLNFLAGLLLLFVKEEEQCFWLLNIITQEYLPGTHELSLEGSKVDLAVLMTSLYESMPAVWAKIAGDMDADLAIRPQTAMTNAKPAAAKKPARPLRRRDLAPPLGRLPPITLCMTAWFMSCFIGTLPIESTLRVWDVMFYEGSKTLFRIALAIFKLGEHEIEAMMDPMEMFSVVQTIPRRMLDPNTLMEACFRRRNGFGHLSQETTEARRKERRAQVRQERKSMESGGGGGGSEVAESASRTLFGRKK